MYDNQEEQEEEPEEDMEGYDDAEDQEYAENDLEAQEIANMLNGVQKENDLAPEIRELQDQDDDDENEDQMAYIESEEKQQILRGGQNIEEENDEEVDQEMAMQLQ